MPEPDKSIGQKILSFFVKEEEPGVATGTPPTPAAVSGPRPVLQSTPVTTSPAAPSQAIDAKFAEHLANVLAQSNPPGPDYFEFRETLRSLISLGLPEEKQFQAAWASFKALGGPADVNVLTSTANGYLAALNKDRDGFGQSVKAALAERVGGLENEQKRLQVENEALAKQLVEIQKQMDANKNRLTAIEGEVNEQSAKITQNQQSYESTFTHFLHQIKDDIGKMTQYLK
jgi:hypothetical protein